MGHQWCSQLLVLYSLILHLSLESIIPILLEVSNTKKIVKGKFHSYWSFQADHLLSKFPRHSVVWMLQVRREHQVELVDITSFICHSFALHKGAFCDAFCDALSLWYGWTPPRLPSNCALAASFPVEHSLHCLISGSLAIHHNELRNTTAHQLTKVCSGVRVEPPLQKLSGRFLSDATAIQQYQVQADIAARCFWDKHRKAFFDFRVLILLPISTSILPFPLVTKLMRGD